MKVEFSESDVLGPELIVSASEFVKAKKTVQEFDSLVHATKVFWYFFGIDYEITEEEYDAVSSWLDKSDFVIFAIGEDYRRRDQWCEIYVSHNGQLTRIMDSEDGNYHLKRRAKPTSKTVAVPRRRKAKGGRADE